MTKKIEILVADDEREMRQILGFILKSHGYDNISYAVDGPSAITLMQNKNIQLGFIDIDMPGLDGISVVRQAREIRPSCYCIMVSGLSSVRDVKAALEAGASGFIVKPYSAQKILTMLTKFEATM